MSKEPGPVQWDKEENLAFADEYDSYLLFAAFQLWRGTAQDQVVDYLVQIETQHMGLEGSTTARKRAEDVVRAIMAEPAIWTWPDEYGRFR